MLNFFIRKLQLMPNDAFKNKRLLHWVQNFRLHSMDSDIAKAAKQTCQELVSMNRKSKPSYENV
ncbi:hypothetical protein ACTXT7_006306 [Hymenolepis weldensis]